MAEFNTKNIMLAGLKGDSALFYDEIYYASSAVQKDLLIIQETYKFNRKPIVGELIEISIADMTQGEPFMIYRAMCKITATDETWTQMTVQQYVFVGGGSEYQAAHALTADHATTADSADEAEHATTADSATYATSAGSAENADNATFATTAGTAQKAVRDNLGYEIDKVYATITQVASRASADDLEQEISDRQAADNALGDRIDGIVDGTTKVAKAAAADSATKATQDASGRVIANTYAEKSDMNSKLAEKQNEVDETFETTAKTVSGAVNELNTAIEGIRQDILQEAHFRGYFPTNAELQSASGNINDFAYSAQSSHVWVHNGHDWVETIQPVPDKTTPLSSSTPLQDGTASAGSSTSAARGDHVHPTDTSRASASDLSKVTARVTTAENTIDGLKDGSIAAGKAEHAEEADHAASADSATFATSANSAATASRAQMDIAGKYIPDTYATKTELSDETFDRQNADSALGVRIDRLKEGSDVVAKATNADSAGKVNNALRFTKDGSVIATYDGSSGITVDISKESTELNLYLHVVWFQNNSRTDNVCFSFISNNATPASLFELGDDNWLITGVPNGTYPATGTFSFSNYGTKNIMAVIVNSTDMIKLVCADGGYFGASELFDDEQRAHPYSFIDTVTKLL